MEPADGQPSSKASSTKGAGGGGAEAAAGTDHCPGGRLATGSAKGTAENNANGTICQASCGQALGPCHGNAVASELRRLPTDDNSALSSADADGQEVVLAASDSSRIAHLPKEEGDAVREAAAELTLHLAKALCNSQAGEGVREAARGLATNSRQRGLSTGTSSLPSAACSSK